MRGTVIFDGNRDSLGLKSICGPGQAAAGEFSTAQMNPAEVLKDLLSDLYVDSADIAIESVIGEGGFATVYK